MAAFIAKQMVGSKLDSVKGKKLDCSSHNYSNPFSYQCSSITLRPSQEFLD